jgi:DNA-binding NtrC family response regulator
MTRGRVLVVDDEAHARAALRALLQSDGYEVRSAADPLKALAALVGFEAEVVLTDLRLPVMDGLRFMERARREHPHAVFILMTGHPSALRSAEAHRSGAEYFLSKPLDSGVLFAVLERAVEKARLRVDVERLRLGFQARPLGPGGEVPGTGATPARSAEARPVRGAPPGGRGRG